MVASQALNMTHLSTAVRIGKEKHHYIKIITLFALPR